MIAPKVNIKNGVVLPKLFENFRFYGVKIKEWVFKQAGWQRAASCRERAGMNVVMAKRSPVTTVLWHIIKTILN